MREILFRGKRLDNGEWVEGDYIASDFISPWLHGELYVNKGYCDGMEWGEGCFYRIAPATVGQWTGLVDKNGKKVFEGDIVKAWFDDRDSVPFQVCFGQFHDANSDFDEDDFLGWYITTPAFPGEYASILTEIRSGMKYELIGNIYDNPNLLKAD